MEMNNRSPRVSFLNFLFNRLMHMQIPLYVSGFFSIRSVIATWLIGFLGPSKNIISIVSSIFVSFIESVLLMSILSSFFRIHVHVLSIIMLLRIVVNYDGGFASAGRAIGVPLLFDTVY